MKSATIAAVLLIGVAASMVPAFAQAPRQDVFWARTTTDPITLDGVLDEPAWAMAESMVVVFGTDSGIPGSGWKIEGGVLPSDSTRAVFRFLVTPDNQLWMGADVYDRSVGGSIDFNRFDGLLMGIKDHANANAPKPVSEYFYAWWDTVSPPPVGREPFFRGRWANGDGSDRDSTQVANWDARTVVHGVSNDDSSPDAGYTVEMRFNLDAEGCDVTQPGGDVVEWNVSVYDCDWLWPLDPYKLSYNRVWWQSPWGNTAWYNEVAIHARPDVTVDSGPLPYVGPEYIVADGASYATPTVDGSLTEPVWGDVDGFDIRYGDDSLRQTYPGRGPWRSGQYQAVVNGGQAPVLDPGDATVRMFFKGTDLYLGFDVRDQVVQYVANYDRWDGFLVTISDRSIRSPDNALQDRRMSFQVGPTGAAVPQDYLSTLVSEGDADVAIHLNTGTTVDTLGQQADNGYTAELRINLQRLGYPPDLGDKALFIGIDLLDGDSFTPYTDSYGTRTWWFREFEGQCCPAWAHLAVGTPVTGVGDRGTPKPGYALIGAFPNPAASPGIRFSLPEPARGVLELYDVNGREVDRVDLGLIPAGTQEARYDGAGRSSGIYFYRVRLTDPQSGTVKALLQGKLVLTR